MSQSQSHQVKEVDPEGVASKGLKANTIGLWGATVIGLASTAPVYSLAATIGFVVAYAGTQAPGFMILAFIPMLLTAYAYREMNAVIPDAGTTFTWGTKGLGPHIGWMGGWAVAVSGIVFLANAAQVCGAYFFDIIGRHDLASNKTWVVVVGIAIVSLMAWIAYRGLEIGEWVQTVLVILQYIALAMLAVACLWAVYHGNGQDGSIKPAWDWLNPFAAGISFVDFSKAVLLCLFIYWGWDAVLAVNEETKDPEKTPGRAALIATVLLLLAYVGTTMATVSYAGTGDTGTGLNNPDVQENVFMAVAEPLLGTWGTTFILVVTLISAAAAAMTTILPTARGTLAMAVYKALPDKFAAVHPKYKTPGFSTMVATIIGLLYYVIMTFVSENLLEDTITSIALAIAFYYAITSFACIAYFRKDLFTDTRSFFFKFLFPLLSGISLFAAFVISAVQMWNVDYGETVLFGIGGVFVIGVGALLIGVVLMFIWQAMAPPFFRGETLTTDTPVLVED